jgi:hypothetical protein
MPECRDTTGMMLGRIDRDVPDETDVVIVQPGSNDQRFFGTLQQRAANVEKWRAGCALVPLCLPVVPP